MVDRLQYPARAAQDPETISEGQRDEIQWFQPLSEPIRQLAGVAAFAALLATGAASLGDADDPPDEAVTLDELQPLSIPVLPLHTQHPAAFAVIDPETLAEGLRDELQWFQPLSLPVLPEHLTRIGISVIDSETLGDPLRDEIQWFQALSLPVLPQHQTDLGWTVADFEEPDAAVDDSLEWFQRLSEPTLPLHLVRAGINVIDPETLAEPLRDELQWFQPLSEPTRRVAEAIGAGGILEDVPVVADDPDTSWYTPLSEPVLPEHLFQRAEASIIDSETLSETLRDELQWFQPLSTPVLPPTSVANMPATFPDPGTLGDVASVFVARSRITTPAAPDRSFVVASSSRTFTPADD